MYIVQPELWQFKDFPIETILFFSNFHQNFENLDKYEISFYNPQKALPCTASLSMQAYQL